MPDPRKVAIITGASRGIGVGLAAGSGVPVHITQRAIRRMVSQAGGDVVNISTSLVDRADSTRPSALPSLTKGGLAAVVRALAVEYASRGVRVNAVALGVIKTAMHDPASYAGARRASSTWPPGRDRRCR